MNIKQKLVAATMVALVAGSLSGCIIDGDAYHRHHERRDDSAQHHMGPPPANASASQHFGPPPAR